MWTEEQKSTFRRLMELREKRDEAKESLSKAEEEYRTFEAEMWDRMTEDGTLTTKDSTVRVPLGEPYGTITFSPRETLYGRILDKKKAMRYIEDRQLSDEFTEPGIVMARINELVRGLSESGEAPPDGIDWYARRYLTITRQKS